MRYQRVSYYVEWTGKKNIGEISSFLISGGARYLYVDEDMEHQYIPGQSFSHTHTVFRFYTGQARQAHELLSALAMQPGVYSAGELI